LTEVEVTITLRVTQMRQAGPDQADRTLQGQLVAGVPRLGRGGVEGAGRWTTRVDDDDVESSQRLHGGVHRGRRRFRVREVEGSPAHGADLLRGLRELVPAAGDDVHRRPLADEGGGARPAQAAAGGGDERATPLQLQIHAVWTPVAFCWSIIG
jgi:hypothetical protein